MENKIISVCKTQKRLYLFFCLSLVLLYSICENVFTDIPMFEGASVQTKYVVSIVMILTTLTAIPCSLRFFKFHFVRNKIQANGIESFSRLLLVRLLILIDMIFFNMILYYFFGCEPTYGYLAVITILALPFVYPTKDNILGIWDDIIPSTEETKEE